MNNTLEDVSMEIPMKCISGDCGFCDLNERRGNTPHDCVERLAAEIQRLRDEREAIVDVWQDAPERANNAQVHFWDGRGKSAYSPLYKRELSKSPAQEIAEERTKELIALYPQYESCKEELIKVFAEFEERTKKEGGK